MGIIYPDDGCRKLLSNLSTVPPDYTCIISQETVTEFDYSDFLITDENLQRLCHNC